MIYIHPTTSVCDVTCKKQPYSIMPGTDQIPPDKMSLQKKMYSTDHADHADPTDRADNTYHIPGTW